MEDERIERLKAKLHGTRERAPGTIAYYVQTAERFLEGIDHREFTSADVDVYISRRRAAGIAERTLRKEFFALKRFVTANGVDWPFTREDRPAPSTPPKKTFLKPAQVEQMILAQAKLSKAERFYLAVSTTWACRREAMAQIIKRDFDEHAFLIRGVHRGEPVNHLMPEVLKPVLLDWPGTHSTRALSDMFLRISATAGLELPSGYGWHSVRRTITSMMAGILPRHGLAQSLWAEYTGWTKKAKGRAFMGSEMMGEYSDTAAIDEDPFTIDRQIYGVHPFLKVWAAALFPITVTTNPPFEQIPPKTQDALIQVARAAATMVEAEESPLDKRLTALRKALQ